MRTSSLPSRIEANEYIFSEFLVLQKGSTARSIVVRRGEQEMPDQNVEMRLSTRGMTLLVSLLRASCVVWP